MVLEGKWYQSPDSFYNSLMTNLSQAGHLEHKDIAR